jgi:hypothetical protein
VWLRTQICVGGSKRFFYLSFGSDGLKGFYTLNFSLWYHHDVEIDAFDNIIPWEKDLYVSMLSKKVEEENEKLQLKESAQRAAAARK